MTQDGRRRASIHTVNGSGAGLRTALDTGLAAASSRAITLGAQVDGHRRRQPLAQARLTVDILTRHPHDGRRVGAAGDVIQSIQIAASCRDANVAARREGREEHNPSQYNWVGHGPLAWEAAARNR